MNLPAVLSSIHTAGVVLAVDNGTLKARGPVDSIAAVRPLIAAHKAVLLTLLSAPPCPRCRRQTDERHRCWHCCDRPCSECSRPTGSAFVSTCPACDVAEESGRAAA